MIFVAIFLTLVIYQAVIEQNSKIAATERTVITTVQPTALMKSYCVIAVL